MIKIANGKRIESDVADRIVFIYEIHLFDTISIEYLLFKDANKGVIMNKTKHVVILDAKLYSTMRLMLERRFLRDIGELR